MANKSIKELPKATQIQEDDALPMQQGPTTKQVTGLTLTLWLLGMADGHGGVKDFEKLSESGLEKTYQFTMADTTKYTFTVTDGNGVADFHQSVSGLVHTYKLIMDNGQEYTMTIKDGEKGDKGDNAYVWFRFASEKPTSSSSSMGEEPDDWIGFYSGNKPTAPTDPMEYVWAPFRGRQGLTGAPATLIRAVVEYQVSTSATVEPSGNWSESIPAVPQGNYLWSRTTIQFNTGGIIQILNKSRDGLDGLGSVVSVNNVSPDQSGNVSLSADDIGAVDKSGDTMEGPLHMNGKVLDGLNDPKQDDEAARKAYVDKSVRSAAPVNLLDNSDFTNPVNQRDVSIGNTPDQYFIDRWKFNRNMDDATYQLVPGTGIKFGAGTWLSQFIPLTQAQMDNKTYTIAVWLADGTVWVQPVLFTAQDSYVSAPWNNQGFGTWFTDESWRITLSNLPACTIKHIALYEGEYTAETLPEYRSKGYGAELAECLRYFQTFNSRVRNIPGSGSVIAYPMSFNVPMRIRPTVTNVISDETVRVGEDSATKVGFSIYVTAEFSNDINLYTEFSADL